MIFVVLAGLDSVPATANTQSRTAARNARAYEKSGHLLYEHALALYNRKNPEDMRAALPFFRRAAEDFRAAGAHGKQAGALLGAGFVLRHLGYDREALRHFTGALLLYRRVKHRPGEVDALLNIGATHFSLQDSEKSLDHFNEALAIARRIRERKGAANALTGIAQVRVVRGELQKAIDAYDEAIPMLRALGDFHSENLARKNLAVIKEQMREQDAPRN